MPKNVSKKIEVGDYCCLIDDGEMGCNPFNCNCPAEDIKFEVSCKHQNHDYIAIKCEFAGMCDYAQQVTERDLEEYPDLFMEESD